MPPEFEMLSVSLGSNVVVSFPQEKHKSIKAEINNNFFIRGKLDIINQSEKYNDFQVIIC